jgi:hypothetical protein
MKDINFALRESHIKDMPAVIFREVSAYQSIAEDFNISPTIVEEYVIEFIYQSIDSYRQ